MLELIIANLKTRPFRTLISVIGVGLGVVLVVLFTGLARGMSNEMAHRANNYKAEILFTRPDTISIDSSNAPVSLTYLKKLSEIEGVKSVTPLYVYISPDPNGRFGTLRLDGIDWDSFSAMNDTSLTSGRAPAADDEIILDERQMREDKRKLGDEMVLFGNKPYRIVGVFAPPSGARIKMSITAMQNALQNPNKCTVILVKLKDGADQDAMAKMLNQALPGNQIDLTRDLVTNAQDRLPALNTFLKVLVGLGAFVSIIFVLLSMYTTITERRKEIGILKSLGASKSFIIGTIEGEAFFIGVLGVVLGFIVSLVASYAISVIFELFFEFGAGWIVTAIVIAIGGSLIGALYPAWRASAIDPVEVMVNE